MSIFSKVKSAVAKGVKAVGSAIGNVLGTAKKSASASTSSPNVASVASAFGSSGGSASSTPSTLGAGARSSGTSGSWNAPAMTPVGAGGAATLAAGAKGQSSPLTGIARASSLAAGAKSIGYTPVNSYGGFTPTPSSFLNAGQRPSSGTTSLMSAAGDTEPVQEFTPQADQETFNTVNSNIISTPTNSVTLPSAPVYSNPGSVNTAGVASMLSGQKQLDPKTGLLVDVPVDPLKEEEARRQKEFQELLGLVPKKDRVSDDSVVQSADDEVKRRKQEVNNYTAQLNSIVAKQNADLLTLRGIGAAEGVTEAVYGGQAATINREAAIKALPVQAQISAAQGNLQLAQDYLTDLKKVKQDAIDADYTYNTKKFESIAGFVTGEQKARLEKLQLAEKRAYDAATKNVEAQDTWAKYAAENGRPDLIARIQALNPASPTFRQDLGEVTSRIQDLDAAKKAREAAAPAEGGQLYQGLSSSTATAVRGQVAAFKAEPLVQNFATIQEGNNFAKSLSNSTKNPVDDQSLIYALAKVLDPGSVVREGEYATAQKYAQSWVKSFGKSVEQAAAGTGFLSAEARKNIKATIESRYNASKKSYDALRKDYVGGINDLTGRDDGDKFVRDYQVVDDSQAKAGAEDEALLSKYGL